MERARPTSGPVAAAVALAVVLGGLPLLGAYGLTWDEAAADLCWGQRWLGFYTSLDRSWLDPDRPPPGPVPLPALERSPLRRDPWVTFPVGPALGAASATVLSRWLGALDPVDGFHAANLFLVAVLAAAMVHFLWPRVGPGAATLAPALLLAQPRLVYHVAANLKDTPHMVLFALAAMAWIAALERGSAGGTVASGALWGVALAARPNAAFAPLVPLAVALALPRPWGERRRLLAALAAGLAVGAAVAVALTPDLWAGPRGAAGRRLAYLVGRSLAPAQVAEAGAAAMVALTTPPTLLLLAAAGAVPIAAGVRRRSPLAVGMAAWVAAVSLRYLLGLTRNYDGVRHLLELFPALAIAAAWGARLAWERLGGGRLAAAVLALAVLAPPAAAAARLHPFGVAYWNALAGGLAGARSRGLPQAGDYWAASYRLGISWLNAHAEPGALLAVPVAEHVVAVEGPLWLRTDIRLLAISSPLGPRLDPRAVPWLGELASWRPLYVMFVVREDWANALTRDCRRRLRPAASWMVDGEPVLLVYRYRPPAR